MSNKFEGLTVENTGSDDECYNPTTTQYPTEMKPDREDHLLQYKYTLWYSKKIQGKQLTSYGDTLHKVATFSSVEKFWDLYSHLVFPGELIAHSDYLLFKDGIRPLWEDDANKNGGKWIIRLKKGLASRCWESMVLAMLGEQFMVGDELCGVVISVRFQEDILSVWNKTATDEVTTKRIRDTLKRVLNLPANTIIEYKKHNDSLRDHSSYRNTDVYLK